MAGKLSLSRHGGSKAPEHHLAGQCRRGAYGLPNKSIVSVTKCTLPSPIRRFTPPGWWLRADIVKFRFVEHRPLLDVVQDAGDPSRCAAVAVRPGFRPLVAIGQRALLLVVHVQRQADLLKMVRALQPPGRFPRSLHRRQQQRDQDANDGDNHEQLHERKTV